MGENQKGSLPFFMRIMIEKFQDWLLEQDIHDVAYWLTVIVYTSCMIITLILNGWIFNNWAMVIIGSIVMNIIRQYSGGFHCTSLVKCIICTNSLFIVFGFAAKFLSYYILLPLVAIGIIWIVYRTPVIETDYKDMSDSWHKCQVLEWCGILCTLALVLQVIGFRFIAGNILWSIVLTAILCFENPLAILNEQG